MMLRPRYYLIWIDSRWNLSNWSHADETVSGHMQEICEAIASDFGVPHYSERLGHPVQSRWPQYDMDDGSSWWDADVWDILTQREAKAFLRRRRRSEKMALERQTPKPKSEKAKRCPVSF